MTFRPCLKDILLVFIAVSAGYILGTARMKCREVPSPSAVENFAAPGRDDVPANSGAEAESKEGAHASGSITASASSGSTSSPGRLEKWEKAKEAWRKQTAAEEDVVVDDSDDDVVVVDASEDEETQANYPDLPDVSAVLAMYKESGNRDQAIAQLRRLGGLSPAQLGEIVKLAGNSAQDIQLIMAESLAAIGTVEALQELGKLIIAAPDDIRPDLVDAASHVTNPQAIPYLFEIIRASGEEDLLQSAQQALGNMCDQNLFGEIISRYDASQDETERDNLLGAIRHISNPQVVPYLTELALVPGTDYSDPLALAVIDTLGIIGTPSAVEALINLIGVAEKDNRDELMAAVDRVSAPEAYELLARTAMGQSGKSVDARVAAMGALANYNRNQYVPILQSLQQSGEEEIRRTANDLLSVKKRH